MEEYVLSINSFNTQKVLKDKEAICTLIVRLLLLTAGTIQSRPKMGVGIVKKWRYMNVEKINDLRLEITDQISIYLPFLQGVDVQLDTDGINKELIIKISVDGTLYILETDMASNSIKLINI